MNILITGGAGFVGYSITKFLLEKSKNNIYSIDNLNNYYSVKLKKSRVKELKKFKKFNFKKIDICSRKKIDNYIKKNKISFIIHLAAQAGVSYSLKNPNSYFDNNIMGFYNILELARLNKIAKIIYASSSSVYGHQSNKKFSEKDKIKKINNFYALSKISNEELAKFYSDKFNIKSI
tara:strand:- start:175 stop:705 length:531 start_codon:yes stop_codon:yes gene_type:complete